MGICMREKRKAYRVLVGTPGGVRLLGDLGIGRESAWKLVLE